MRIRKIAVALFACMAVAAVSASAAQAAWSVSGGTVPATVKVEKMGTANLKLSSSVLGEPVELTATGIECASAITACTIDEEVTANHSMGALKFTGVTVDSPANCEAGELVGGVYHVGSLTTKPLTDMVEMVTVAGSTNTFDKFFPEAGETGQTFFELTLEGAECALAGIAVPVKGYFYGETEATGVSLVNQPVRFNAASNSISGLTLGGSRASLSGEVTNSLTGANAGKAFSAS